MSVSVAEYLGQRTDISTPVISPVPNRAGARCPFMNDLCSKVQEGYKPICSVRKRDGIIWIVCRHRLCSTKKDIRLSSYQVGILLQVARTTFNSNIAPEDVYVRREESMRVTQRSRYHADFIMIRSSQNNPSQAPTRVVLEMQGGGETSNTGDLTTHIAAWEKDPNRSNATLSSAVQTVGTIETNAWRRQQEQFLVKGSIANQTGGGIILCIGASLFDYLMTKLRNANLPNLRQGNWALVLIGFTENITSPVAPGPIPLSIDRNRLLFTNYISFVNALVTQGNPAPEIFRGQFDTLAGGTIFIP